MDETIKKTAAGPAPATLTLKARAKINLALDVIGKRQDGYHEVAMIMQSISLADTVTLEKTSGGISLTTDHPGLADTQDNLAFRAAPLLKNHCQVDKGVKISIEKKIPLAAGLAGGSADAAATLLGLVKLWELPLSWEELSRLGASLGSDVPFCLFGGTMLATGRGETVAPLPPISKCYVILAKPPIEVSTAWVYGNYSAEGVSSEKPPDIAAMKDCLERGDLKGVAGKLSNALEKVTVKAHPQIELLKKRMLEYGAMASLMSGSGPTVFGLAETQEKAAGILKKFQTAPGFDGELYLAETVCGGGTFL